MKCTLPPEIVAYLDSPEFKAAKHEADEWSDMLDRLTAPIVAATAGRWQLLEFTPAQREIMAGDPDLAFQVEYGDWVLRMDYAHEIGNGSFLWRKGSEDAAEREFELFAHGTPTRLATPAEVAEFGWAFESACRSLANHLHLNA